MTTSCEARYMARLYAAPGHEGGISAITLSVPAALPPGTTNEPSLACCFPASPYSKAMQGNIDVAMNVLTLLRNTNLTTHAF